MSPDSKDVCNPSKSDRVATHENIFSQMYKPLGLEHHTFNRISVSITHLFAVYYCYAEITECLPLTIIVFDLFIGYIGGLGVTVGTHRYWAHKTFKAKLPLQILLMFMQTISFQFPIHWWCLHHRMHHKYTDTEADPHNSRRGFWFSQIGWLLLPMSREFKSKLKSIDMSDLETDPVVRFQSRWYFILLTVLTFIIPCLLVHNIWKISLLYCFASACRRYVVSYHITACVNSVAHLWGYRPYDRNISATEGPLLSVFTAGEGWHNYHHTFPWDYKASEFGWRINASTLFIDFFSYIGWAYDLKSVSHKVLNDRMIRNGKGSHDNDINNLGI